MAVKSRYQIIEFVKFFLAVYSKGRLSLMAIMRGEPLVTKLAMLAKYVVFPGAMVAALVYSPPDFASKKEEPTIK